MKSTAQLTTRAVCYETAVTQLPRRFLFSFAVFPVARSGRNVKNWICSAILPAAVLLVLGLLSLELILRKR